MKKGIMIFCGVCVLVFAGWTIKCAVDFAEKAEKEQKAQVVEIEKEIKKQAEELKQRAEKRKEKEKMFIEKQKEKKKVIQPEIIIPDDGIVCVVKNLKGEDLKKWSRGVKKIVQEIKRKYGGRIKFAAKKHDINPKIITAVIAIESSGNHRAVSPVGAKGLMQLMPKTAQIMGIKDAFHPYDNIWGGAKYLKRLEKRFGDFDIALAAYNLGPTKVAELLKNGFNSSAYKYVRKVKAIMAII